jgi:hypothetical protein
MLDVFSYKQLRCCAPLARRWRAWRSIRNGGLVK